MQLSEIQSIMTKALFAPGNDSTTFDANSYFKSSSKLSGRERLDIYRRNYWGRLIGSFYDDFPGLLAILGKDRFHKLAQAYLEAHPSRSFTLRNLGQFLEEWLIANPHFADADFDCALDMIRLEWAHIEAFDAEERVPLGINELAAAGARTCFSLQPYIKQLCLHYAVDDIRIAAKESDTQSDIDRTRHGSIFIIVHRQDNSVYYLTTSREEWTLLSLLQAGKTLETAIFESFADSQLADNEKAKLITACFHRWAHFGWLCENEETEI